jgi:hypothetical protein
MRQQRLSVGYWANTKQWTKTHVAEFGKPICGSKVLKDKKFQWCCNGIMIEYLECEHCKKLAERRLKCLS